MIQQTPKYRRRIHVWVHSLVIQKCESCMAISLGCMQAVWAPPITWHSLGPALCGPHAVRIVVPQDDAISEISHTVQTNWMPWSGRWYSPALPLCNFRTIKAVHSHCTMMCRTLWYSGLGSSPSNSLLMRYTDLYINGTSVKCLWWFFSVCCSTYTFEHLQRAFSCTWHIMYFLVYKTWLFSLNIVLKLWYMLLFTGVSYCEEVRINEINFFYVNSLL